MAFTIANWGCQQPSMNAGQETVTPFGGSPTVVNTINVFTYASPNDTVATIIAADYFLSLFNILNVGDIIWGSGTDASFAVTVATVSSTSVTVVSMGLTTSIGTANIVAGAVTATELASDAVTTVKILDNNVTSAKLALNTLQYLAVPITAAEFNGMYAAPKLLVAAGGANTLIVLDKLDLLLTFGSAAFAAGGVAAVQYDSTANGAGVIASTTRAAADFFVVASTGFGFNMGVVAQTFTTCVNKGLYLSNITGAFTTGTGSSLVAHIWYKIVPTV